MSKLHVGLLFFLTCLHWATCEGDARSEWFSELSRSYQRRWDSFPTEEEAERNERALWSVMFVQELDHNRRRSESMQQNLG